MRNPFDYFLRLFGRQLGDDVLEELNAYTWPGSPAGAATAGAGGMGGATMSYMSYMAHMTPRKTVYRVGARSGEVRELPATSGPGASLDLFGVYVGEVFETQEAAVRFAEQYCREQAEKLMKQAESHRDWLARHEPQRFQIGDKVAYVGMPPFLHDVRGYVREVVAVRRDAGEGFKYQVAFPRHETTWIPQRDLSLRVPAEAGKKRDLEVQ